MSSEWPTTTLGDLITVKHGFAFKGEFFVDTPTAHQLTTPGNFAVGGGFQVGKGKHYNGPIPNDFVLKRNALVVTMTDLSKAADTLGFGAVVPDTEGTIWLHNQRVGLVTVKDPLQTSAAFLHYLMRGPNYRHQVVSTATGSTVKHTSPDRICAFKFALPPLRVQTAVGAILTNIDDRIALLRETNATLEAIAQALFKSWFVDFDPVRAKQEGRAPEGMSEATAALFPDQFEESELGLVPRGWKVGVLRDIAHTVRKQLQISDLREEMQYVGLEHIPRKSLSLISWGTADGLESAKAAFSEGDILFGRLRPYFHKVVIAPFDGVCSTDILVCQGSTSAFYGVTAMHLFSDPLIQYADRLSNGAKMPRVSWKDLASYPVLIPSEALAAEYTRSLTPMFDRLKANVHAAQTLAALRDTLLPRLISGQLRLPEAEVMLDNA